MGGRPTSLAACWSLSNVASTNANDGRMEPSINFGRKQHQVNNEQLPADTSNINNINAISNHKLPIANQPSSVQHVFSACVHIAYDQSGIPNLGRRRSKLRGPVGWLETPSGREFHIKATKAHGFRKVPKKPVCFQLIQLPGYLTPRPFDTIYFEPCLPNKVSTKKSIL